MASEREWNLACEAVDGELTPERAAEFRAMVADSPEARVLHATLAEQARRLVELPRVAAPIGLFDAVMTGIGAAPVVSVPIVVAPVPLPKSRSMVGPIAIAAAAFVVVVIGSLNWSAPRQVVVNPAKLPQAHGFNPTPREVGPSPTVVLPKMSEVAPLPAPASVEVAELAPTPRPLSMPAVEGGVSFASGPRFVTLPIRTPLLAAVGELDSNPVASQIRDLAAGATVLRGDLFVADPHVALLALRPMLQAAGIELFANPGLFESDKSADGWAFYSEKLTEADRTRLFTALDQAGRAGKLPGATLHLYAATPADARDFRDLTGVDRGLWKPARHPDSASVTTDEVAETLRNRHKSVLIVPLAPAPRPTAILGAEVKAFWQKAHAAPSGAILIVCRGV